MQKLYFKATLYNNNNNKNKPANSIVFSRQSVYMRSKCQTIVKQTYWHLNAIYIHSNLHSTQKNRLTYSFTNLGALCDNDFHTSHSKCIIQALQAESNTQ